MEHSGEKNTYGFVEPGAVGGSVARALKRAEKCRIIVCDPDTGVLDQVKKARIADEVTTQIDATLSSCDIIFLCSSISHSIFNFRMVIPYLKPGAILTDLAPVKSTMHLLSEKLTVASCYVGGHPMVALPADATSFAQSSTRFIKDCTYALTRTAQTDLARLARMETLVRKIGAQPLILDAKAHDRLLGAVTHLPHVALASFLRELADTEDEDGTLQALSSALLKDRIKEFSFSPDVWRQILILNAPVISSVLDEYITVLQKTKRLIDKSDADALRAMFEEARAFRDSL